MSIDIEIRLDHKRGCGWHKEGGLYLISGGPAIGCGKLPVPLVVCPTCGGGIKPTRGWTWVNAAALLAERKCGAPPDYCGHCPLPAIGRAGLLWIGSAFYKTPADFCDEAERLGISRRIAQIPRDLKLGETWVLLVAHREAIRNPDDSMSPGIFRAFMPRAIEYVVKADDTDEKLERLIERGITPVRVERAGEQKPLPIGT